MRMLSRFRVQTFFSGLLNHDVRFFEGIAALCAVFLFPPTDALTQPARLPAGTFSLGVENAEPDERPQKTVYVSSFLIDRYEVTFAQYDSCVKAGACTPAHYDDGRCLVSSKAGFRRVTVPSHYRGDNLPAVCITWYQARQYCHWKGGDLPTETQWEYAALAGKNKTYSWGNTAPNDRNCTQADQRHPNPPGTFRPNLWGLYDMTGNVWEWTRDRYHADFYEFAETSDPHAPGIGRYRSIRGGGWYSAPKQLRIKNRHWFAPEVGEVSIGFRCVKELQ